MAVKKLPKKDKNIQYVWIQIENWLKHRFKTPIMVEVFEKPNLTKKIHKYSVTLLQKGKFNVYIDKRHLLRASKDDLLNIVGRESCRIYLMSQGINVRETTPEFKELVLSFGLPWYGVQPEEGMMLYEYRCINCNKIITVSPRKIPKSKKLTYNPLKVTECCGAMIKESDDKHHYTNKELQIIQDKLEKE